MIGSALLALGLVLGVASQLRLPSFPLGVGEACLLLWLGLALLHVLTIKRLCNPGALLWLGTFWGVFAFTLTLGTCLALLRQELDPESMLHDTFAYLLGATISCFVAATMRSDGTLRQAQWFLIAFWSIALVAQLALGWEFIHISSVEPWYWDRFRGWSENPNQLALYCAIVTALSLHLVLSAKGLGRLVAAFSFLASFVVGRMTKSDAFLGAMVISGALVLVLRLRSWLVSPEHRFSMRFVTAAFLAIAIAPLSLSLIPYAAATADDLEDLAASMTKDHGGDATRRTAMLRLELWRAGLYTGVKTGSLGLGPGPHLERPIGLASSSRSSRYFEAHSMLLDVFTQAGLVGVITVYSLFIGAFWLALRAKLDILAVLIITLVIFGGSHFILRHPIVWFAIALSLVLSSVRAPRLHACNGT